MSNGTSHRDSPRVRVRLCCCVSEQTKLTEWAREARIASPAAAPQSFASEADTPSGSERGAPLAHPTPADAVGEEPSAIASTQAMSDERRPIEVCCNMSKPGFLTEPGTAKIG